MKALIKGFGLALWVLLSSYLQAQTEPKYELRSAWIASVSNIDWPKYEHRDNPDEQKQELIRMLELYKSINLNAVFLQVRPECDALYNSAYEPWSRYLTWAQGDDPGYDPLAFALEEAHKRGIELHVWMNPYRINASTSDGGNYYHETHIYSEHPEWAIEYGNGKKILNPGRPEVMSYIGSVVRDLVSNYHVDGVHFDDYFYSYDGTAASLDATEYEAYGNGMSLGDWRRDNVNRMIDTVYQNIQDVNPNIRFGVSPFGIYKNGVPAGIVGLDAYSTIYCDPLAWLENESVDYITPQLYWPTGGAQDFESLANWWSDQVFANNRHLYTGHGIYRFSTNPSEDKAATTIQLHEHKGYFDKNLSVLEQRNVNDWTLSEIGLQIDIVRLNQGKNALGNVYFSADDFDRVNGLADYIVQNKYTHKTIIPEMTWKNGTAPNAPQNLKLEEFDGEQILTWEHVGGLNMRYAIYSSSSLASAEEIIADANNLNLISFNDTVKFDDLDFTDGASFVVTAISAIGKESLPSEVLNPEVDFPIVTLIFPEQDAVLSNSDSLGWTVSQESAAFVVQIASNLNFSNIVYESEWLNDTVFAIADAALPGEGHYYWRVRAKTEIQGPYSDERTFETGYPVMPELIAPENLDQNLATQPNIVWDATWRTDHVQVLVSEENSYNVIVADELFDASSEQGILETELEKDTWYYLKIRSVNTYGVSEYTQSVSFKTTAGTIPDVLIEFPADGATVASYDYLQWTSSVTEGEISYKLEIALDETFDVVVFQSDWLAQKIIAIEALYIDGQKTYFWRVKASSEFGESNFTPGRSFSTGYPSRPTITAPQNLSDDVNTRPYLSWNCDASADSVYFEFSEQSSFANIAASENFHVDNSNARLTNSLNALTTYYMQMQAKNEYGSSVFSAKKSFTTGLVGINSAKQSSDILEVYPSLLAAENLYVAYKIDEASWIKIDVVNALGSRVANIFNGKAQAGSTILKVENSVFTQTGVYIVRLEIAGETYVRKLIVN